MAGKKKDKTKEEIRENTGETADTALRALAAMGSLRLSLLLKDRVEDEVFSKYPRVLMGDVAEDELREGEEFFSARPELAGLFSILGENAVARSLVELLCLRFMGWHAEEVLELANNGNGRGVSLLTAARAAGYTGMTDEALVSMREAAEKLRFLLGAPEEAGEDFHRAVYRLDEYLLGRLGGSEEMDRAFAEFAGKRNCGEEMAPLYGVDAERKMLVKRLKEHDGAFDLLISGERESGRYSLVAAACEECDIDLLTVEFDYICGTQEPKEVLRRLVRSCILENRALVVRSIKRIRDADFLIGRLERLYRMHCSKPLFLLTEPEVKLIPVLCSEYFALRIPRGAAMALALWKGYLPKKNKELAESLASKMTLTAGQIRRVARAMETEAAAGEKIDERMICRLCYEVLDDGRYDNIKRVEPGFTLDDLKIDERNRNVLNDIVKQVELRHAVYDGWNLKKKYAYGRCVSVILAGPPGTGKTMTVHALAGQLGLELYKVDLSQIVDKYIGETEKRLEEVFTRAQKSNMILFFDEADAVMGKRSEVKDSKDKYANTEISFILQRIEEYDGIVLLATNNLQNIDQAFMRRIRYVLSFQLPDKETRKGIWESAFGKDVPLAKDIDYEFLAEKFELSGGEIKNIVLNAVFYGCADGGEVGMPHIMKALYRENTKLKRIAFDGDYGGYAYLLHD